MSFVIDIFTHYLYNLANYDLSSRFTGFCRNCPGRRGLDDVYALYAQLFPAGSHCDGTEKKAYAPLIHHNKK